MEFRVLGPLEVEQDGRVLAVGATKQRAVLAALVVHANRPVSRDRLIDAVWGDEPPDTAATALQGYVSGLRKVLGAERILTRPRGYVLAADPHAIDVDAFESDARAGAEALAAGDPRTASALLAAALGRWRGEPLADLDSTPFVAAERLRLDELRLAALEDRVDAELALARHAGLVPELQALVREHPLRERLRGQLMLALYRSGRQAEALEVYRRGRHELAEQLGLEPGEALRLLERRILENDPALASRAPVSPEQGGGRRTPRRRRVVVASVAAALLAAAGSLGLLLALRGSSAAAVAANSIVAVDIATNRLLGDVALDDVPVDVAVAPGAVWAVTAGGTLVRIDPRTRKVLDEVDVGAEAHDLAVGFGSVWVAHGTEGVLTRVDAELASVEAEVLLNARSESEPRPAFWIAAGPQAVWVMHGDRLVRIDPANNDVVGTYRVPAATGLAVDPDSGSVWLTTYERQLVEFFPGLSSVTRTVDMYDLGAAPSARAGSIWSIVYAGYGEVRRVDSETGLTETVGPGARTFLLDLAVDGRTIWTVEAAGTVRRVDRRTGHVVARTETAPTVRSALAVGEGAVWIALQQPS